MGSATRVASSASQIELSSNFPILYFFSFLNSSIILNVTILNRSVDIQHPCLMPPVTSTFSFILPSFITVLCVYMYVCKYMCMCVYICLYVLCVCCCCCCCCCC